MIGNGYPYGAQGFVILEEGEINPATLSLDVSHYLVIRPDGSQVSGTFSFLEAQECIHELELKSKQK